MELTEPRYYALFLLFDVWLCSDRHVTYRTYLYDTSLCQWLKPGKDGINKRGEVWWQRPTVHNMEAIQNRSSFSCFRPLQTHLLCTSLQIQSVAELFDLSTMKVGIDHLPTRILTDRTGKV